MIEGFRDKEIPGQYSRIHLLGGATTPPSMYVRELRAAYLLEETIITTDFLVKGDGGEPIISLEGELLGVFYRDTGVISIDHHLEIPEMWRHISSTNLAIQYIRMQAQMGKIFVPGEGKISPVQISHTDADSILSGGVLASYIKPEMHFDEAAIAADHTGAENAIADLLMAIESRRDVAYSLTCLEALLNGGVLPEDAQRLLDERKAERARARSIIEKGIIAPVPSVKGIYYGKLEKDIAGELLPALIPDAKIIIFASPMKNSENMAVKVRTGVLFPEGKSLQQLGLPNYGGRWNAGSTKRHGGTENPGDFVQMLCERFAALEQTTS